MRVEDPQANERAKRRGAERGDQETWFVEKLYRDVPKQFDQRRQL
jgi:hypothetical protein